MYDELGKRLRSLAGILPQKQTHADRIRAMTDEELAAYLGHASLCVTIQGEDGGAWCSQYGSCNECIRDWLKEEAVETPGEDINVPGTYDLLYEEGGPDTR